MRLMNAINEFRRILLVCNAFMWRSQLDIGRVLEQEAHCVPKPEAHSVVLSSQSSSQTTRLTQTEIINMVKLKMATAAERKLIKFFVGLFEFLKFNQKN